MKRIGRSLIAALMASMIFSTTALAVPTVNELRDDKDKAKKKIESLESQMVDTMAMINKTEEELVKTGQAVIKANEDLEKAEKKEVEQYESMKKRIVAMYENGNTSMIAMILEAENMTEMLQQAENVKAIHEYDRKQLTEYVKTKEEISELKASLEKDMAAIEKKQKEYQKEKDNLNGMIADLEDKVDDIDRRIQRAAASAATNSGSQNQGNSNSGSNYVPPVGTGGGAAIVAEAYKYLGVPYVWGGASMSGVDCSGLVMLAHKAIGVNLSHYSGAQGSGGKAVSRAEALPGDVVCYSGHVGIYLGNGQMIHAPQTGDVVRVVSVYGNPWFRRYW